MIGKAVIYTTPDGVDVDALVTHQFPHVEISGAPDRQIVNLVYVTTDESDEGPLGRATKIATSVPIKGADDGVTADAQPAPARGWWRSIAAIALLVSGLLAACLPAGVALAQVSNVPNWFPRNILNDTCAVGFMDSTRVVDMTNHHYLSIRVSVEPPAGGAAEPWAVVYLRAIGSYLAACDSNSTCILQMQPIADHSYQSAVAGDSLAYGDWSPGNAVTPGNGIVPVRATRRSTKWAYPHAYGFEVGNKGQLARFRYVYIQAFSVASSGGAPRIKIDSEQSN